MNIKYMFGNFRYIYQRYIHAGMQFIVTLAVWLVLFYFILYYMPSYTSRYWFFSVGITLGILPIMASFELTIILFLTSFLVFSMIRDYGNSFLFPNYEWLFGGVSVLFSYIVWLFILFFIIFFRKKYYKRPKGNFLTNIYREISGANEKPGLIFKVGKYSTSYDAQWDDYKVLILELDDMGQLYDWDDINSSLEKVESIDSSICLITFVHGWNHNASNRKRGNLKSFLQYISKLQKKFDDLEQKICVVGIFIAWQGQRYIQPLQRFMTFFDRSDKSREVGSGDIRSIYSIIDEKMKNRKDINIIHVGHSFGASVMFTALSSSILDKLIYPNKLVPKRAIVMLNPAFEGKYYLPIYNKIKNITQCNYVPMRKRVYILTSENDDALNGLFFVFKFVKIFTSHFRSDLQQKCLNTSVGNIEEFITRDCGKRFHKKKSGSKKNNGFITVNKVSQSLIKDHNDIWNGKFDKYIISWCR